ncbi:MAG: sugar transferase [Bacteroidales bacterium]|nr:sugar transferase [Bacteroidales bacterium]MBP3254730.1 sugar transferase [Bacteroidales bacterium]
MKRLFDIVFSLLGLIATCWLFALIALAIKISSKGGVFYKQYRVGKDNKDFLLYKFRSMRIGADKGPLITVGGKDPRVTRIGYYIRKYKLDELPQLINVLKGDMSFVGPRPEVRYYVDMYNDTQRRVLDVRPGITDPASIAYRNENELLARQSDPQQYYIDVIMPDKLRINAQYLQNRTLLSDIKVIFRTFAAI